MSKYTINDARSLAISCAGIYEKKLRDNQFLIIYRDHDSKEIEYIEVVFLSRNYQHLTGLNFIDEDGNTLENRSEFFYKKCVQKKLASGDISMKDDGTTHLKLEALPALSQFTSVTKIIGDTNGRQPYLYVEKLVGGVNFCLGLRRDEKIREYVPVSALKKDIKTLTDTPSQVLAIFERKYGDSEAYHVIRHVAKGLNLLNLTLPDKIKDRISLSDYKPRNAVL